MSFSLNENNLYELKRRQVKHEVKIRRGHVDMNAQLSDKRQWMDCILGEEKK